MEKQKNMPGLRFAEFTEGWVKKTLGEVGDVKMCRRIFNEETLSEGEIPFYKIGSFGKVADAFITQKLYLDYRERFSFPKKGDILISAAGTIGRLVVYNGEDAYFQDSNIIWIDNNNSIVSNEFLFFILQIVKFNTEGGTIQRLYNNILKSTQFSCPILPEQQKIATFFTAIDKKLSGLKEKKTLLTQYKKGVMQQLFSQALRFKNTEGGEFADWEVKKLGEVTDKTDKKNKANISYPVYSINNKEGFLPQSDQFEGVDSHDRGYDVSLYKIIQTNTFAYNPARIDVGSIGFSGDLNNIIISSLYVCFKTRSELNDSFLMIYLKSDAFNKAVLRKTEGGVRKYLFYENFSDIEIPLPSIAEQQKIANFISALDEKITNVSTQIEKIETWKKGLLQKMFV